MKKYENGFSLIEVVIAIGFVGFIGLLVTTVNTEAIKGSKRASDKTSIHADLLVQENAFSSLINTFDLRMTFTGPGLTSPSNTYESRFLIPLPQTCRDLKTEGCENDTSLMFINYREKYNPAAEMYCNYHYPKAPFPKTLNGYPNARILVFSQNLTRYGVTEISTGTSKIKNQGIPDTYFSGEISFKKNEIFVVQDGKSGSLWRVVQELRRLSPPQNEIERHIRKNQMGAKCYDKLVMDTNQNVYYLYAVPLKPNHLSNNYYTDLKHQYSYKVMNTEILSIGRRDSDTSFGVNKCHIDTSTQKISCDESYPFPLLNDISLVRMDEEFKFPLLPEKITKWYDVGKPCVEESGCSLGDAELLPVPNTPRGLVQNLSGPSTPGVPSFENPNSPLLLEKEFSFYKQEFLHRIRFRIKQKDKRRDIFVRFY